MKKVLFAISILTIIAASIAPAALGQYYGYDAYDATGYYYENTGNYYPANYYNYNYAPDYYGPMPYYDTVRPVYRVTSTIPNGYVTPYYTQPVYAYDNYSYGTTYGGRFSDVSPSDPNYAAIQWMGEQQIAGGFQNGTLFLPYKTVTRAEFVAMIVKGAGLTPSESTYRNCFSDVSTEWYANEVCYAKAKGWLPVNYTTHFYGTQSITTVDARNILVRAYGADPTMPNTTYLSRSQAAGILYFLLRNGQVSVRDNNVAAYNTLTSFYNYDQYSNNFSNPTYCETNYYDSSRCGTYYANQYYNNGYYYDNNYYNDNYYYNNNYVAYDNMYYGNNYYGGTARTVRYNDPWSVYVPAGYNGPWGY